MSQRIDIAALSQFCADVIPRGHWGVPNTAIPYEKLANTEIPCRKWTKYRYRMYTREINLSLREKT